MNPNNNQYYNPQGGMYGIPNPNMNRGYPPQPGNVPITPIGNQPMVGGMMGAVPPKPFQNTGNMNVMNQGNWNNGPGIPPPANRGIPPNNFGNTMGNISMNRPNNVPYPNMGMNNNMMGQPNMGMNNNMMGQPNMGMNNNMMGQPNMGMNNNMMGQPNMGMNNNMMGQPNMGMNNNNMMGQPNGGSQPSLTIPQNKGNTFVGSSTNLPYNPNPAPNPQPYNPNPAPNPQPYNPNKRSSNEVPSFQPNPSINKNSQPSYPTFDPIPFKVPEVNKEKYTNLYGILAAIDTLEAEHVEGFIDESDYQRLFNELKRPFELIVTSLRIDERQVQEFCEAMKLSASYALFALYHKSNQAEPQPSAPQAPQSSKLTQSDLIQFGTVVVTISDMCHLGNISNSLFNTKFQLVVSIIRKTDFLSKNNEANSIIAKWNNKFLEMPADSSMDTKDLAALKSDIQNLEGLFKNSLN